MDKVNVNIETEKWIFDKSDDWNPTPITVKQGQKMKALNRGQYSLNHLEEERLWVV